MGPVVFTAKGPGITGDIRYGGTATYHLRLPAGAGNTGRLPYVDGDLSKIVATARVTPGGNLAGTWTFARKG